MTHRKSMFILGIDPGYDRMGVAIIDFNYSKREIKDIIKMGLISTAAQATYSRRIVELWQDLNDLLSGYDIRLVGIENVVAIKRNRRLASVLEVTGIVKLSVALRGISIIELFPTQVKKIVTGRGNASKDLVRRTLRASVYNNELPSTVLDDTIDSVAIAYTAGVIWSSRYNKLGKLNKIIQLNHGKE